jgi:threonine synthase
MNVGHPSNLARLVDVYGGWMDETGELHRSPDLESMRRDLYGISVSDDETRATIKDAHERHGVILEPHGAVAWAGLERFLEAYPDRAGQLAVSVETAHPAKFPEEIGATIGIDPPPPPSLAGLEDRSEQYEVFSTEYEPFRELLLSQYAHC